MDKNVKFIKDILGDDIFDKFEKSEIGANIFKPNAKVSINAAEIKIALQIVPRTILSYLIFNLKPMQVGGTLTLDLPFADARLLVNKISNDVYSGEITGNGKRITEFSYRSLPSVGLIIMSTFELYGDFGQLEDSNSGKEAELQKIIDDRFKLRDLVDNVVSQKMSQRDAINQMISDRISEAFAKENCYEEDEDDIQHNEECSENPVESSEECQVENDSLEEPIEVVDEDGTDIMNSDKKSKLKRFLEERENKRKEEVSIEKGEIITCEDCNTVLYKGEDHFKLCVCFGQHHNENIKIKKTEKGNYVFKFPKKFDTDNVELLLDTIKSSK